MMLNTNWTQLVDIPTWNDVLADPAKAGALPPDVARTWLCALAGVLPVLIAQASKATAACDKPAAIEKWLSVEETVSQFGVSARWLYAHKRQLPHSQPSRKVLLFPEERLRRWFTARKTG